MTKPQVSICIPAYNASRTIGKTLETLLDQSFKNISIHVVDNASHDNTLDIARDIEDPRIHVHTNIVHADTAEKNWNRCLEYATGTYVGIFHADDEFNRDMISRQIDVLMDNKDVCAVLTGAEHIDDDSRLIKSVLPIDEYKDKKLTARDVILATLTHGNTLYTPSALMVTETYRNVLHPWRGDLFSYSSDLDMWIRAANYSHIYVINQPLLRYRVSKYQGSTAIHESRTAESAFFKTMDYHLPYYKDIPQDAIDKYEIRRLNDKLVCIKNGIQNLGWKIPDSVLWALKQKIG